MLVKNRSGISSRFGRGHWFVGRPTGYRRTAADAERRGRHSPSERGDEEFPGRAAFRIKKKVFIPGLFLSPSPRISLLFRSPSLGGRTSRGTDRSLPSNVDPFFTTLTEPGYNSRERSMLEAFRSLASITVLGGGWSERFRGLAA